MISLNTYINELLSRGRAYFSREEAMAALNMSSAAFSAAAVRLVKKKQLALLRRGFYLVLRPEDRVAGAPDPVRWIDPLMKYLQIPYRISLLRAAAFHGSSHQAAMIFQVIAPQQLRALTIGRHQIQFIYQVPSAFAQANNENELALIKSEAGFAVIAGVELTLLDCARYFHKVGGIHSLAQIVKDIGARAKYKKLATLAMAYENSSVRRLGYLLELVGHTQQAKALEGFVKQAKSMALLDPAIKLVSHLLSNAHEKNTRWMLIINESVEIDF